MLESEFRARATTRDVARLLALRNMEIREENRARLKAKLKNQSTMGTNTGGKFKRNMKGGARGS